MKRSTESGKIFVRATSEKELICHLNPEGWKTQVLVNGLDSKFCEGLEGLRRSKSHGGLWVCRIVLVSFLLLWENISSKHKGRKNSLSSVFQGIVSYCWKSRQEIQTSRVSNFSLAQRKHSEQGNL